MFKTKSGGFGFDVMSMDEVKAHAIKYSKGYSSAFSPWKTNLEEMAKKTVVKIRINTVKSTGIKYDDAKGISPLV